MGRTSRTHGEDAPGSAGRHVHCTSKGRRITTRSTASSSETGDLLMQKPNTVIFVAEDRVLLHPHRYGQHRARRVHVEGDRARCDVRSHGGRPLRRTAEDVAARRRVDARPGWRDRRGAGRVDRVRRPCGGSRRVHHATAHQSRTAGPTGRPDGSRIVYAGVGKEGFDLYVMNADGTDVEQITDQPGDEFTTCVVARRGSGGVRLRRRGGDGLAVGSGIRRTRRLGLDGVGGPHRTSASSLRPGRRMENGSRSPSSSAGCRSRTSWTPTAATSSDSWSSPVSRSRWTPDGRRILISTA